MSKTSDYNTCLQAMYGLRRFGIKLGLDTIGGILAGIGDPHKRLNCIHVAGTNGKGSVASALSTILYFSGYKVGLYTSPHLVRFNERICINNRPISDTRVVESYLAVHRSCRGLREPTFFELATAMAFYEFGIQNVDWAVIETGMGGRLDATNIVKPKLSVITNISLEHREYLGNTIAEIAGEKGGIIKTGTPAVTAAKQKTAVRTLDEIAAANNAPLFRFGSDFRVRRNRDKTFNYSGMDTELRHVKAGLEGAYQTENAALTIAACEIVNKTSTQIPIEAIRNGLERNKWPGRLEIVSSDPPVLLDGAHNLPAVRNLARHLKENFGTRSIALVLGILDDKPYAAMMKTLLPLCSSLVLTRAVTDRALSVETLSAAAKPYISNVTLIDNVRTAVEYAIENASPEAMICVAGSLYVVGEAKEALEKRGIRAFDLADDPKPSKPLTFAA
ncbi:MAG: folylpolyglutamate synthase/dihydrofolate synthase family protein [Desulfobacterales bacterium]